LLLATLTGANNTAGYDFDWTLYINGDVQAASVADSALALGLVAGVVKSTVNVGQHVVTNSAIEAAVRGGYRYLLRLDDDVVFKTKRWLAKLRQLSILADDKWIISPRVYGLINPISLSTVVTAYDTQIRIAADAIGGICRFHPIELVKDYVSDVRLPMGAGDATGIARYCTAKIIPMVYAQNVRVQHALGTAVQMELDPQYFAVHDVLQHIPYIPAHRG